MRLFIATDLNAATRDELRRAQAVIREIVGGARVPPRVTWVDPAIAHVTLYFIGETPAPQVQEIQNALAALQVTPFEVTWATLGTFGASRRPRVVWVAPSRGTDRFVELASRVAECVGPLMAGRRTAGPEPRFSPHVTLARVRDAGRGTDWPGAFHAARFAPTTMRVDGVTLYHSHLSPRGPTYTALSTYG